MKISKTNAFTLIELLVVISIIAILAGIALPVFGEVQIRGNQTKALSNAKQVGTACKLWAMDNQGNYPHYNSSTPDATGKFTEATSADDANIVLATLMPDYLPEKSVFSIPKSAFCKPATVGKGSELLAGENEWAYVLGVSDTSHSRWPLLADGFAGGTGAAAGADPYYVGDDSLKGGVWKGKKAVVIRVDVSGTVESTFKKGGATGPTAQSTVKRDDNATKNAFAQDAQSDPAWLTGTGVSILNPK